MNAGEDETVVAVAELVPGEDGSVGFSFVGYQPIGGSDRVDSLSPVRDRSEDSVFFPSLFVQLLIMLSQEFDISIAQGLPSI